MTSSLCFIAADRPVVIISRSTIPVSGSVADCRVAFNIRSIAYSTSSSVTSFDSLIFAKASLILIKDSNCRGVAEIVFLLRPLALRLLYYFLSF